MKAAERIPMLAVADTGPFQLPPLPWPTNALEPVISKGAVELHHGKHHRGYVKKLNALIAGTEFEHMTLEDVVRATAGEPANREIHDNAGQVWNHTFFFEGLRPPGPLVVPLRLQDRIDTEFGGMEAMNARLVQAAVARFGSGWAWLSLRGRSLEVSSSPNAGSPLTTGTIPLLALDVWEHAYYLDYHERREAYAKAVLSMLVDWHQVARRAGLE